MDYHKKYLKYKKKYEKLSQVGGETKPELEGLLDKFFEHQIQIKMLHFQTKYYGYHKMLDDYLCAFCANFDKFMEAAQGVLGRRLNNDSVNINAQMWKDDDAIAMLDDFVKNTLNTSDLYDYKGLSAIRDEMVVEAEKLKYLLTFK